MWALYGQLRPNHEAAHLFEGSARTAAYHMLAYYCCCHYYYYYYYYCCRYYGDDDDDDNDDLHRAHEAAHVVCRAGSGCGP